MKTILKTFVLLLFINVGASYAQSKNARGHKTPEERVARMDKVLKLSDKQESEILNLFKSHASEKESIKEEMHKNRAERQERVHKELATFLDKEQLAKLKTIREEEKSRMRDMHKDFDRVERKEIKKKRKENHKRIQERIKKELNLTPEQQKQMKSIHKRERKMMEEKRSSHKNHRAEYQERINMELKEILTPEQWLKFEKLKKRRARRK
jgi:Spy/CpxP family protein refolding chaperone